jgi:polysaccharide biosynthesis transport protein
MSLEKSQTDVFKQYMNLVFDWYRVIAFFLLLAVTLGVAIYLNEPKLYESQASILYQQQRINPSRLSPDDERQIGEMVNTMAQQVMSRSSLEKIVREYDLYPEMRQNAPIENVIERMRSKDILITMDRTQGNVFSVSYTASDPQKAMQVTNALASRFIEENLRLREERATDTTRYIRDELQMSKKVLDKKEAEMRDYKLKHYNEMPDQRAANLSRLNSLQQQLEATQRRITDLEQTRVLVSEQLENRRNLHRLEAGLVHMERPGAGRRDELSEARRHLQEMLSRYTSEHPAVRRAQSRVEQIRSEYGAYSAQGDLGPDSDAAEILDPRMNELANQSRELEMNLETLRGEVKNIRERMQKYEQWIDATPVREAEWTALTRDYNQHRTYHDQLLAQSLAAEASESLERRQQGSQFRIVDSAYLPRTAVKGTFLKILFLAIGTGFAVAGGLMIAATTMDSSLKDARDVESYLELPVTCALPLIPTKAEKKRNRMISILWHLFFGAWFLALIVVTTYFYMNGDIII